MNRLSWTGFGIVLIGWAVLLADLVVSNLALKGGNAVAVLSWRADVLALAQTAIASGFGLAVVGTLRSGFGAFTLFFNAVLQRSAVQPRPKEPTPLEPEPVVVDRKAAEPRPMEPRVEPRTVEPRVAEPRSVEPRIVEPRNVEPRNVEPRNVEPMTVEPDRIYSFEPVPTRPPDIITVTPTTVEPSPRPRPERRPTRERNFVILSDGSVEVETMFGTRVFANLDEAKDFIR